MSALVRLNAINHCIDGSRRVNHGAPDCVHPFLRLARETDRSAELAGAAVGATSVGVGRDGDGEGNDGGGDGELHGEYGIEG